MIRFFSFAARTSRIRWMAWFALALGLSMIAAIMLTHFGDYAVVGIYAALGLIAAKLITETVRRVHDCDQNGWLVLAVGVGIAALLTTAGIRWLGHGDDAIVWSSLGLVLVGGAVLVGRPGTPSANRFGPPPPQFEVHHVRETYPGALVATILVLVSISGGFGVRAWQEALAGERLARVQRAEPVAAKPRVPSDVPDRSHDSLDHNNAVLSNRIDDLLRERKP
ncbi:DUF805 domain-containing protein [Sphingomonas paucimobilis]|uniref:DUF805 domain-containing protein n=1 Tax=Sphingomonas paucimobilis TaxID=13689 RepID=UPI002278E049